MVPKIFEEEIENVSLIDINTTMYDVRVLSTDEEKIKVTWQGNMFSKFICPLLDVVKDAGVVRINFSSPTLRLIHIGKNNGEIELMVYIPKSYSKEINMNCHYGDMKINDISVSNMVIRSKFGDIRANNISSDNMNAVATFGDISVSNFSGKANITTTFGDTRVEVIKPQGDIYTETTFGDIKISVPEEANFNIDASTFLGDKIYKTDDGNRIKLKNKNVSLPSENLRKISAKSTCGDITIRKSAMF